MIDVFFTVGDLAASARFDAIAWEIAATGRLHLYDRLDKMVASFNEGVWQYVCQVSVEVPPQGADKEALKRP